jgi:hypothetical protein
VLAVAQAFTAASTMWGGVGKSGWPMPRLTTSRPCRCNSVARASTAKAVLLADARNDLTMSSMALPHAAAAAGIHRNSPSKSN